MSESRFNKARRACNFIMKRLQQRCFLVKFTSFINSYFEEHLQTTVSIKTTVATCEYPIYQNITSNHAKSRRKVRANFGTNEECKKINPEFCDQIDQPRRLKFEGLSLFTSFLKKKKKKKRKLEKLKVK